MPANVVRRLNKSKQLKKGMDINLSQTNIRKQVRGTLLTSILSLGKTLLPTFGKTLGLSGLASEGASQIVENISGQGVKTGGLIIPYNRINELIPYANMFTTKQQRDIMNALKMGKGLHIYPSKKQSRGFLGTLLAIIGIPLGVEAIKS